MLIRSRALEARLEAADHLVKLAETGEEAEKVSALEAAKEAYIFEQFLVLLDEVTSGKKRDTDEPLEFYELVVKVPKTNTT